MFRFDFVAGERLRNFTQRASLLTIPYSCIRLDEKELERLIPNPTKLRNAYEVLKSKAAQTLEHSRGERVGFHWFRLSIHRCNTMNSGDSRVYALFMELRKTFLFPFFFLFFLCVCVCVCEENLFGWTLANINDNRLLRECRRPRSTITFSVTTGTSIRSKALALSDPSSFSFFLLFLSFTLHRFLDR